MCFICRVMRLRDHEVGVRVGRGLLSCLTVPSVRELIFVEDPDAEMKPGNILPETFRKEFPIPSYPTR